MVIPGSQYPTYYFYRPKSVDKGTNKLIVVVVLQYFTRISVFCQVRACTLRGQLELQFAETPLDISEVEPAAEIVKRFATGNVIQAELARFSTVLSPRF